MALRDWRAAASTRRTLNGVVARGIPGTGMRSFATVLSRPDLVAVVAYVATLNGVANPKIGVGDDEAAGGLGS